MFGSLKIRKYLGGEGSRPEAWGDMGYCCGSLGRIALLRDECGWRKYVIEGM
jgi:hypothetical protein